VGLGEKEMTIHFHFDKIQFKSSSIFDEMRVKWTRHRVKNEKT